MEFSTSGTISVVVPTYNSASVIKDCLDSLGRQSHAPENVVVCDGGSTDDTVAIATFAGATVVHADANRSVQRNTGALHARGEFIVFIDSDMRLSHEVLRDCVLNFRTSDAALVIPEVFTGESYWAKVRGFERTFYEGVWWLQAARCYRREQFVEIGGFDVGLIGPEDWDLDERIRQFGKVREISAVIDHNEGQTNFGKLLQKKNHYSKSFPEFEIRHPERATLCLSGRRRVSLFLRRPLNLITHPMLTAGIVAMGISEIFVVRGWLNFWNSEFLERPMDLAKNPLLNDDQSN